MSRISMSDMYCSNMDDMNRISMSDYAEFTTFDLHCLLCNNVKRMTVDIESGFYLCDNCIEKLQHTTYTLDRHIRDLHIIFDRLLYNVKESRNRYLYIIFMCNKLKQLHIISDFDVSYSCISFKIRLYVEYYGSVSFEFPLALKTHRADTTLRKLDIAPKEPGIIPKEMFEL